MADATETLGEKGLRTPCARSRACPPRLTCGAAGSGLCSAARMLRPPRVRVLPRPRLLRRHRGLQLQWRRRPSGASPSPDSRRLGPPPPANSWPGSRDRGAHPRLPHPGPGAAPHPLRLGRRGCSAALGPIGEGAWEQGSGREGDCRRRKWLLLCSIFISRSRPGLRLSRKGELRLYGASPLPPSQRTPGLRGWVATCGPRCLSKISPRKNVPCTLLTNMS